VGFVTHAPGCLSPGEGAGVPRPADDAMPDDTHQPLPPPAADEAVAGDHALPLDPAAADPIPRVAPQRLRPARGRRLVHKADTQALKFTPEQRLLLLDTWRRSGLPAGDFAALVGLSKHTLYGWKRRFEAEGPAGLMDKPRGGPQGSKLSDLTKRTILLLKQADPSWGCQRISDLLLRGPALPASPSAVARVLHEAGYELEETPTRPHEPPVHRFERARANQLWQTDLFTFLLKRQNRRVYLVAFLDDHARFITGYGLHASQSSALVLEVLRAALTSHGTPEEILTDNGSQYVTWRGKSAFTKELEQRGIRQVVAAPRRPQTLGKIERFWGTLWRECLQTAVFLDLGDAQQRIGHFIDHYNFQRPHQGIDGLVPADRYFGAASAVRAALQARVAANARELARQGVPRPPFYLAGAVGGQPFSVHAEGERVILTGADGRREVDLVPPRPTASDSAVSPIPNPDASGTATGDNALSPMPEPVCPAADLAGALDSEAEDAEEPAAPGSSPLDDGLRQLRAAFGTAEGGRP
jgi:transposase InsO family protein